MQIYSRETESKFPGQNFGRSEYPNELLFLNVFSEKVSELKTQNLTPKVTFLVC